MPQIEGRLAENDLFRIMQILNCREVVLSMEKKIELDNRRRKIIHDKGFDSYDYILQLVADTKVITGLQKDAIEEVTNQVGILSDILESSRDAYIREMKQDEST